MNKPKYILVTHVWNDGPSQALRDYLISNKADFIWIAHPLFHSKKIDGSGYSIYTNGIETKRNYAASKKRIGPLKYIIEILLNIAFVYKLPKNLNYIYIGYNNLNTFSGLVLKKLGRVQKVIYYVIDYMPKRFNNGLLNRIFHKIDQLCVKRADETWNLNEKAMNAARMKFYAFNSYKKGCSIQREIPMGFWKNRIQLKSFAKINKNQVVFMGHILEKQGIQYVLQALSIVIKTIKNIKLVVIGEGEYLPELQRLAQQLHIEKNVEFIGFVKELHDIEEILCSSSLAVAMYEEGNPDINFTYYTDQGKIKMYLGCGLPILVSNVPPIAKDIEKNKCGFIIDNNPTTIAHKIIEILSDKDKLQYYRNNVLAYRDQFDWDIIFSNFIEK